MFRSVGDERYDNNFLVANKYRSFIMSSPEIEMRVIKARPSLPAQHSGNTALHRAAACTHSIQQ
jgi:hypothetical protein